MNLEAVGTYIAGALNSGGWETKAAWALVDIVQQYRDGEVEVKELPAAPAGLEDPMEKFARAQAGQAITVQLEMLLPSLWAHAGACGQGGVWVRWNGRSSWQVVPLAVHHIGLGQTGAGKTTMLDLAGVPFGKAMKAGQKAAKESVECVAADQRAAIDASLKGWQDECNSHLDKEEAAAFALVRGAAIKAVDNTSFAVVTALLESGELADATVEAAVSLGCNGGGAVMIRAAEQDFLDNLTRYSASGQSGSLSLLTQGWDGGDYMRLRKGSGLESVSALVLSMALMTQRASFAVLFDSQSGQALLSKGVLGRALVTAGGAVVIPLLVAEEANRLEDALAGVEAAEADSADLVEAWSKLAVAGAECRALRALEGKVRQAILDDRRVLGIGDSRAMEELSRALDSAEFVAGRAVTRMGLMSDGGQDGQAGQVWELPRELSIKLESLYVLCRLTAADGGGGPEDSVLAPVMSRVVSHIVRIGMLRWVCAGAVEGEEEKWLGDTAARVMPWVLREHIATVSSVAAAGASESLRVDALRESKVADGSLLGLVAAKLVAGTGPGGLEWCVEDPKKEVTATKVATWVVMKIGKQLPGNWNVKHRAVVDALRAAQDGGPGAEWFTVTPAAGKGLKVLPGDRYMRMLQKKAAGS